MLHKLILHGGNFLFDSIEGPFNGHFLLVVLSSNYAVSFAACKKTHLFNGSVCRPEFLVKQKSLRCIDSQFWCFLCAKLQVLIVKYKYCGCCKALQVIDIMCGPCLNSTHISKFGYLNIPSKAQFLYVRLL
jgi:hypothetical protein